MSFQFPRKPEKQAFSLLKCRIKNKLLHVAVSAFHTPPRDSPKKCDKWHIWQFVAPLASSSQQPHPRTSSVAGKAHQAGRPATHTTYQATPGYSPPPEKHASVFGFSTYGYLQFDMISFHQHPSFGRSRSRHKNVSSSPHSGFISAKFIPGRRIFWFWQTVQHSPARGSIASQPSRHARLTAPPA